jgi:hypothetical protein
MVHLNFRTLAAAGALVLSVSVLAKGDEEAVNKRIAPVARVELAPAAANVRIFKWTMAAFPG